MEKGSYWTILIGATQTKELHKSIKIVQKIILISCYTLDDIIISKQLV